MTVIGVVFVLIALAALAPRYGADSRGLCDRGGPDEGTSGRASRDGGEWWA